MKRLFFYALAMFFLIMTLHACDLFEAEHPYPDGKASVRVMHIAPLAPESISYFHLEEVVFSNLNFGDVTDFTDVPVGRNPDGFLNAGGDTLAVRDLMRGGNMDMRFFDFERSFTVFVMHGPAAAENVRIRSMEIEPVPNAEGKARVRILHAVSGAGSVDVYLSALNQGLDDEDLFAIDLPFNNEGGAADTAPAEMPLYAAADPGTYNIQITANNDSNVIYSESVTLDASRNYTMILYPTAENDGIDRIFLLADN